MVEIIVHEEVIVVAADSLVDHHIQVDFLVVDEVAEEALFVGNYFII